MPAEQTTPDRSRPDACPGALQVHQAADGALARVRLPGGFLEPTQLQALAEAARELAAGELELTSRGNVQLRAVTDPGRFAELLAEIGLLPSATHERVRNILASPLSGRIGGLVDVRDWVRDLDRGLCADPALAQLPGRVMFSLDDGRGDVSGLSADLGLHAVGADDVALVLAGRDSGGRIAASDGVPVLLEAARHLLDIRGDRWRLHEIDGGAEQILKRLGLRDAAPVDLPRGDTGPIGWLDHDDGGVTLAAGLALGTITARTAEFLAAVDKPLVVTPWRSLLLCDLDEWTAEQVVRVLAPMGLIFDAASPWLQVSACTGSPGCAKSLADVRGDLGAAMEAGELPAEGRQHWVGCDRKCGRPSGEVTDVVATGDGYRVDRPTR
ncbi:precorrin-3B synthase [Rhodococcus sp. NPDC058514]|uniref:precorrin-3B synthase n=1 Tax=unclassified Rhodococcus (in: high G+C Gram-positive bacteria) TaxID=192944 RepID=UPI00364EB84F